MVDCNNTIPLQDVLNNESLKLDFEFKISMISDIVRALEYLHRSALCSHGNLSAASSLVDSRMSVLLSEFGISSLFSDKQLQSCVKPQYVSWQSTLS